MPGSVRHCSPADRATLGRLYGQLHCLMLDVRGVGANIAEDSYVTTRLEDFERAIDRAKNALIDVMGEDRR